MDKRYTVHTTDEADNMLVEHAVFLARFSLSAANKLIEEFEEKAESLRSMPERNPYLDAPLLPEKKYRKLLLLKRYQIIYRISDDDNVVISYVIDCRQDNSWLIF